jgi:hypothetical protein
LGGNPICCGGKKCCKILCFGPAKAGIPIRAHPRIGNIFLHALCITIAFVFAYARVEYSAGFMDYIESINTPYVDPVEQAFMKEFGIEPKPNRRLLFINRFLKASGGAGGGSGGGSGGAGVNIDAITSPAASSSSFNPEATNIKTTESAKEFIFLENNMNNESPYHYYSIEPILRMSLSMTILHFINIMIMLPRNKFSEAWHDGFWFLKFIIIIALWVLLFSVSNEALRIWLRVAVFGAFTFAFFIVTGMILGILKLNQVVYNSSLKVRNFVHYLVYAINLLTILFILAQFFWFIPKGAETDKVEECGMNALLIITTFGILGVT